MKTVIKLILLLLVFTASSVQAQIFYEIKGNGLSQSSYIFGTHHLAPLSIIDQSKARKAYNSVSQVVGEMDMTQGQMSLALEMQSHMVAPADSTLTKLIGAEKMQQYSALFKELSPASGMELVMFDAMKPMVVNAIVTLGLVKEAMPDFNQNNQIDTYLQMEAKKAGKKVIALETAAQQASFLYDSVSISDQLHALTALFDNPDEAKQSVVKLNRAYMSGNLDELLELTKEENSNPHFFEVILLNRNSDWVKKLPSILSQGSSFIAVGALHLPGEEGLINQLRKLGYTVTPVM